MSYGGKGPVRIPASQLRPEGVSGEPLTVGQSALGFMCPLQWFDESGNAHNDVFFIMGDTVYQAKDSETWAATFGVVKKQLAADVMKRFRAQFKKLVMDVINEESQKKQNLPKKDEVDVFDSAASEVASEVGAAAR